MANPTKQEIAVQREKAREVAEQIADAVGFEVEVQLDIHGTTAVDIIATALAAASGKGAAASIAKERERCALIAETVNDSIRDVGKFRTWITNSNTCLAPLSGGGCALQEHAFDDNGCCVYCEEWKQRAASSVSQWQAIESAPKDRTNILLWWPEWSDEAVIGYHDKKGWLVEGGGHAKIDPSLWQPLPAPPVKEKSE